MRHILDQLFSKTPTLEVTKPVLMEGKHPELIELITLFHQVYTDYDFSQRKVRDVEN